MSEFKGIGFGLRSVSGVEVKEGDIVLWKNPDLGDPQVCLVFWDDQKYSFRLKELDGCDPTYAISNIREGTYEILGSIDDDLTLHGQWCNIGHDETFPDRSRFLKQALPSTCFPLAAINACAGAGVEKSFFNFQLYKKMIAIGECEKWGGCIDEQAVLNEIQSCVDVQFVQTDMECVLEVGGILTLKPGGYHAAAVFIHHGAPYLVNSMLGEGQFIRPMYKTDIPRSDDPENHRDYMLVLGESYH